MRWLRRLWRCLRHDPLRGWELRHGIWYGPHGERCRAISGGEGELFDFASDMGSGAEALSAGGDLATGGGAAMGFDYSPGFTAPPPDPSGFSRFASSLGKEFSDSPISSFTKALGLGATGFGIANQVNVAGQLGKQTKNIQRGQQQATAAAAPAVAFGTETLNRAAGGNLTPALQAGIDQWVQKAKADAAGRLASMGLGNSTDLDSVNRLIDEQAMAMKGTMLQQQEETGLAGLQMGVSAGTGVMGVSQQQQAQLAQLIQSANQALGQMAGRG